MVCLTGSQNNVKLAHASQDQLFRQKHDENIDTIRLHRLHQVRVICEKLMEMKASNPSSFADSAFDPSSLSQLVDGNADEVAMKTLCTIVASIISTSNKRRDEQ